MGKEGRNCSDLTAGYDREYLFSRVTLDANGGSRQDEYASPVAVLRAINCQKEALALPDSARASSQGT